MLLRVFQNELMEHRLIVRDGFRREAMHLDGKARIRIHEGVVLLYPCIGSTSAFPCPRQGRALCRTASARPYP